MGLHINLGHALKDIGHGLSSVEHGAVHLVHDIEHEASKIHIKLPKLPPLQPPWLRNAINSAGKEIGGAAHFVDKGFQDVGKALGKVPFIGPGLHAVWDLEYGTFAAVGAALSGQRIDKVLLGRLKNISDDVKAIGPYVQTIVAVVPGVGTSISSGIGAGLALASGKSITDAMLDAAAGAVPGGPFAVAALKVGVACVKGKGIAEAAIESISGAVGVQIPPVAVKALAQGLDIVGQVAAGKRLDKAILDHANSLVSIIPGVPPAASEAMKIALSTGIGMAQGQNLQHTVKSAIANPAVLDKLATLGKGVAATTPMVASARSMFSSTNITALKAVPDSVRKSASVASMQRGFDVGVGYMQHQQADSFSFKQLRDSLPPDARVAFDAATSLHIGRVIGAKPTGPGNADAQAGYYMTRGLVGAKPEQKTVMVSVLVTNPEAKRGVATAIVVVSDAREDFWVKLAKALGLV